MHNKNLDINLLNGLDEINSFDILSQILPPLSLNYKTKHFGEGENIKTSNKKSNKNKKSKAKKSNDNYSE
jgi:hypothetical protein